MVFNRPRPDGDRIVETGCSKHLIPADTVLRNDVSRFPGADFWSGADDIGTRAAEKRPHHLQISFGLSPCTYFCAAYLTGIPSIVGLIDQVGDHISGDG
jgi:hypothetical protein